MSIEQMPKEELNPKAKKELEELKEKNPSSPIVAYLNTLSTNDLRILDNALNSDSASFYSLNVYEGEEAENAKAVLAEVLKEPDQKKHLGIIKTLP